MILTHLFAIAIPLALLLHLHSTVQGFIISVVSLLAFVFAGALCLFAAFVFAASLKWSLWGIVAVNGYGEETV